MATLLKKRVAKYTLDITANYTEAVTNKKGEFAVADYTTSNSLTIEDHAFKTGDLVAVISATGVTAGTVPAIKTAYFVIVVDANTIKLASSLANAQAGTAVTLDVTNQTGICYLVKQAYGTITTDIVLPAGAVVTDSYYDVITTFTGGNVIGTVNDDSTIALSTGVGAGDLVAAIAIKTAGDVWDDGFRGTLAGSPAVGSNASTLDAGTAIIFKARKAASMIRVTTACNPTIIIGTESVFGGKLELYVEYVS